METDGTHTDAKKPHGEQYCTCYDDRAEPHKERYGEERIEQGTGTFDEVSGAGEERMAHPASCFHVENPLLFPFARTGNPLM